MLFLNQLYSVWDELLDTYGVYKVETIGEYQFSHKSVGYNYVHLRLRAGYIVCKVYKKVNVIGKPRFCNHTQSQ